MGTGREEELSGKEKGGPPLPHAIRHTPLGSAASF